MRMPASKGDKISPFCNHYFLIVDNYSEFINFWLIMGWRFRNQGRESFDIIISAWWFCWVHLRGHKFLFGLRVFLESRLMLERSRDGALLRLRRYWSALRNSAERVGQAPREPSRRETIWICPRQQKLVFTKNAPWRGSISRHYSSSTSQLQPRAAQQRRNDYFH